MSSWVSKHSYAIGIASAIGSWYLLVQSTNQMLARPIQNGIDIMLELQRRQSPFLSLDTGVIGLMLQRGYIFGEVIQLALAATGGLVHWRSIRSRVTREADKSDGDF